MNDELSNRVADMVTRLMTTRPVELKPENRLREDLGLDSVSSMELLSMLAEELDLSVPMEEAAQVVTLGDAIDMARRHVAAKAGTPA